MLPLPCFAVFFNGAKFDLFWQVVFIKGIVNAVDHTEGLVQVGGGIEEGGSGCFHSVLLMKGILEKGLELVPFWVLRAEVNMLKMPHPVQVFFVAVGIDADDFALDKLVIGVGIISSSYGELDGFWDVFLDE